jgi:hypothetical protein
VKVAATLRGVLRRRALDITTSVEGVAKVRTRISPLGDTVTYVARSVINPVNESVLQAHDRALRDALTSVARELRLLTAGLRAASVLTAVVLTVGAFLGGDLRALMPMHPTVRAGALAGTFTVLLVGAYGVLRHLLVRWLLRASS